MAAETDTSTPSTLTQRSWTWKECFYCGLVCLGEVAFAYPSSVIGVTLAQPSFLGYMSLIDGEGVLTSRGASLIGAMSGLYQAGVCFGIIATIYTMDHRGRRWTVILISTIAVTVTLVYTAELSPNGLHGFFGAVNGVAIGLGYAFATYIASLSTVPLYR
ncbi:hypothetical protein LTR17_025842 [Elasticomyces elasticus]|nr:hypothetical protein LTR17_025842 [Elasticomyces elasticus]